MRYINSMFIALSVLFVAGCNTSSKPQLSDAEFEKQIQEKLINAKEGDVIELPEGTYNLTRPLLLDGIKNITIKGQGTDKTILSFKNQKDGAEGMRITADGCVLQDFCIMDCKGDNIKLQDSKKVSIRRVKSGWTAKHSTNNGSYGLYPVQCSDVLVEECEVFGSSDAGIYVGQSKNIIVRNNRVHDNVAGIEIENCEDADVYDNLSENNTGGVLVFDLPDLPVKNGARCRIFNNKIFNNNTRNFGPKGTTVSEIPAGTGIIVMATNQCEVFSNEIRGHNSVSVAIVSYLIMQKPYKDTAYDPYCGGIFIHDNTIERGVGTIDNSVQFGQIFSGMFGGVVPDIIYDGIVNPAYLNPDGSLKEEQKICFQNNGNVTFCNVDLGNKSKNKTTDISKYNCTLPKLNPVNIVTQ